MAPQNEGEELYLDKRAVEREDVTFSRRTKMDKELYCRDVGQDCDFLACGKTEEEALRKLGQHVLAVHGVSGFSKEFYPKAQLAIREGFCDYGDAEETLSEDCSACYEACYACDDECCF
jgi:predicted small metal-binding protein